MLKEAISKKKEETTLEVRALSHKIQQAIILKVKLEKPTCYSYGMEKR